MGPTAAILILPRLQVLVAILVGDDLIFISQPDTLDSKSCKRDQFAGIGNAIAISVFPNPQGSKVLVSDIDFSVGITVV